MSDVLKMPTFDFSKSSIKTTEELEAATPTRNSDKYFRSGNHEVVIEDVEYRGSAKNDVNWGNLAITYLGAGGKTIKDFVLIPFATLTYGEKKTTFPFKKLQGLVAGLGLQLTPETLPEVMNTLFSKPEVLKGLHVGIDVGYPGAYLKFSRNGNNESVCNIMQKDGTLLADAGGAVIGFSDRDSALAYAEQKGLRVDSYASVIGYTKSVTVNKNLTKKTANGGNW